MYSDPTAKFITGNDLVYFKYDPGYNPRPFNVFIKPAGSILICAMVFAQSTFHANAIFKDYVDWFDKMGELYKINKVTDPHGFFLAHDRKLREYRAALDGNTVEIVPCETTQMYKIGWAGNDTW